MRLCVREGARMEQSAPPRPSGHLEITVFSHISFFPVFFWNKRSRLQKKLCFQCSLELVLSFALPVENRKKHQL